MKISELQILSQVKGKGTEPSRLPKYGREIKPGQEPDYLGRKIGKMGRQEIWRDIFGGQVSYTLFDPESRRAMIFTFGSRYSGNPKSYVISGLYASPDSTVSAAEFYRALIHKFDLTLISDRKQSPGGQRVWQKLEKYADVRVYGYDTKKNQPLNIGAKDEEMYSIPADAVQGADAKYLAQNIRLVATKS